jgi:hypothetical protein
MLAVCDCELVIVKRTFAVVAAGKVYDIVTPDPSWVPSTSFVHVYEQGVAVHEDDEASNVTGDPTTGEVGLHVNCGFGPENTVNALELVAVPPAVVTLICPDEAPEGTVAVIDEDVAIVKLALTPLNFTAVAPVKLVPLIVTRMPTAPLVGEKLEMPGVLVVCVTMTSCSTLANWDFASVTVSRTYFVPVPWKVKDIVTPVPNTDESWSSIHL